MRRGSSKIFISGCGRVKKITFHTPHQRYMHLCAFENQSLKKACLIKTQRRKHCKITNQFYGNSNFPHFMWCVPFTFGEEYTEKTTS